MYGISNEKKKIFKQAWIESLAYLFSVLISTEDERQDNRNQLKIEAESIFEDMDSYR